MARALISKFLIFLFLALPAVSQGQEIVDGIAAVVEGEPILLSEIQQAAQTQAMQLGVNPYQNPQEYQQFLMQIQPQVLQSLIDQRIIQAKAEEDSIVVKEHEIEQTLDQQIDNGLQAHR